MTPEIRASLAGALALLLAGPAFAQTAPKPAPPHGPPPHAAPAHEPPGGEPSRGPSGPGLLGLLPAPSTTEHSITLAGRALAYRATAGTLPLRQADGTLTARLFYVAFTALDAPHGTPEPGRPITFVFNGGPGAASAYLMLGGLGPRIVVTGPDGTVPSPPARLADNPDSWLAFTDLVFVDPVGTGYSQVADPADAKKFWGVDADIQAMAAFIRLYLAEAQRTTSPVFLAGESYGGFRAALLAKDLPTGSGVGPSGLVLISPALEFSLLFNHDTGAILPDALELPSMAAVNMVKQGVATRQALAQHLAGVDTFARGDYLADLAAGTVVARDKASVQVASLTGLPVDLVRRHYGRVPMQVFVKEFDHAEGRLLSAYDGTVSGPDPNPASPLPRGADPILDRTVPIWTSAFVDYARSELGYRTDLSYHLLNREISGHWRYSEDPSEQGYAGAMDALQAARTQNPALRVLIANGYTDLVTPFLTTRYLVDQMPPLSGAAPVEVQDYLGGHMMYLRSDSRHALMADAQALYRQAAGK